MQQVLCTDSASCQPEGPRLPFSSGTDDLQHSMDEDNEKRCTVSGSRWHWADSSTEGKEGICSHAQSLQAPGAGQTLAQRAEGRKGTCEMIRSAKRRLVGSSSFAISTAYSALPCV